MKVQKIPRRFYSVPELARAYSVSDQSIYNLINNGVIDCARFGRRRLVLVSEEPKLAARFRLEGAA
jgi:excisionase family DNA binding protein